MALKTTNDGRPSATALLTSSPSRRSLGTCGPSNIWLTLLDAKDDDCSGIPYLLDPAAVLLLLVPAPRED
jgi:hypothetical protein